VLFIPNFAGLALDIISLFPLLIIFLTQPGAITATTSFVSTARILETAEGCTAYSKEKQPITLVKWREKGDFEHCCAVEHHCDGRATREVSRREEYVVRYNWRDGFEEEESRL